MSFNYDSTTAPAAIPSFEEVEQLVQKLYLPGSPQDVSEIQDHLQQLQRSPQGWQLADSLLQSQDDRVRFFAGSAVHADTLGQFPSTSDLIRRMDRLQTLTILWFATTLIEEAGKITPTNGQTHEYHHKAWANLEDVVSIFQATLDVSTGVDMKLAEEGMKCFQSWVMYAHQEWMDKPRELEFLRKVTPYAIHNLTIEGMLEVAAECLTDILGNFSAFFTSNDFSSLAPILCGQSVEALLLSLKHGDFNVDSMALARLLLAYGDAALHNLATHLDDAYSRQIMQQLLQLLACEGFPGAEDEICTSALEFWQTYTEFVIDSIFSEPHEMPHWMVRARETVVQIVELCWNKIQMPPQDITSHWDSETRGDFKAFRADVEDLLQSSYTLLGVELFNRLVELALESLNNRAWLRLEATLFCLNALSESVSDKDSVDQDLSRLFDSTLFRDMVNPEFSIPPKVQQASVNIITNFTAFFERQTNFLPPMLTYLFHSLKNPILGIAAAKAINRTCDSCRVSLVSEVQAFVQQYEILLTWSDVELGTKERVIGAIAAIIQAIPSENVKLVAFSQLIEFVESDVKDCVSMMKNQRVDISQSKGLHALRCLVSMGKALQAPDEAIINLEDESPAQSPEKADIWSSVHSRIVHCIQAVTSLLAGDGEIIEATCQILRSGYKETAPGPFVFAPEVTEAFVTSSDLKTARLEYVLDTATAFLGTHTMRQTTKVNSVARTWFGYLANLIRLFNCDPTLEPEIASSCIELAEKFIPYHLNVFLDLRYRDEVPGLFEFTIRSISCREIMPKRSAALFWASFFQKYELPADVQSVVEVILQEYGPRFCHALIQEIGGEASRSELDTLAEPLKKMVFVQISAKAWLSNALFSNDFPSQKMGDHEKRLWLQKIMK
ncbi:MAG: hypothetical protein LQ342_000673 [Letrouitia transgressa]|nr:MAG: hypothetical protein LQ342_000673 [Letrouitia transgressa]